MKIVVTGPRGFVGARLMSQFPDAIAAPSLRDISREQLRAFLQLHQPDVIVHTAAISDMPTCERYPEESYRANVTLPLMLAQENPGAKLVAFSSDQVYNGCSSDGPYDETIVKPANLYAQEKVEMEQRVLELDPNAVMLRAEWMYDWVAPKGNYIRNILNPGIPLSFSSREFRGVTYVREVAEVMEAVIRLPGGAYNFGSETDRSLLEITKEFLAWMGRDREIQERAPGHNLWMDCSKARKLGVSFSPVSEALKKCARDYGLNP